MTSAPPIRDHPDDLANFTATSVLPRRRGVKDSWPREGCTLGLWRWAPPCATALYYCTRAPFVASTRFCSFLLVLHGSTGRLRHVLLCGRYQPAPKGPCRVAWGASPRILAGSVRKAPAGRRRGTRRARRLPARGTRHRPSGARKTAHVGPLGLAPQATRRRRSAAGMAASQTCIAHCQ